MKVWIIHRIVDVFWRPGGFRQIKHIIAVVDSEDKVQPSIDADNLEQNYEYSVETMEVK